MTCVACISGHTCAYAPTPCHTVSQLTTPGHDSLPATVQGAAQVYEWGDEQDPAAVLYVNEEGLTPGMEFTVSSQDQYNDLLLLHGGYVWLVYL